ncbi:MAG: hypothetical protein EA351_10135 [Gemmatimonadales bacterium]|nr:MAG: hypothetical protein EA351_10135 [Gemmatimonadales bacterium]
MLASSLAGVLVLLLGAGWWVVEQRSDVASSHAGPDHPTEITDAQPVQSDAPVIASAEPSSEAAADANAAGDHSPPPESESPGDEPAVVAPSEVASDPGDGESEEGWMRAVARTFVNIRSTPAADGEVRGVVAENDVVLLGDARGSWREVRSGDIAGWAWEPLFQVGGGND